MSRPSRSEQERLEALEGASALLDEALRACGILSVRLRQVWRRAPELGAALELAGDEVARVVDGCDGARELLHQVLEVEQEERSRRNRAGSGEYGGK